MDVANLKEMHGNIYTSKVNGIIPWACIQRPTKWVGGDPNPGTAFRVAEDGTYEILRGYYYYKLLSRAGQPGIAVARTMAMDSEVAVIAFARSTNHPTPALVSLLGTSESRSRCWAAARSRASHGGRGPVPALGIVKLEGDTLL
jgi:hypothetical protein